MSPATHSFFRIQDVAERAGVSPATVSRVLNGTATVDATKRDLVLAAVDELGYRPNRVASNLRRQHVRAIGVVISDVENPFFAEMVRAAADAAYLRGYRVLLCNTDEHPATQRDYLDVLAGERVAGVIISPSAPKAPEIGQLIDHGTCVVAFDRAVSDGRADVVLAANLDGARRATEHLLGGGHLRVGFVGGPVGVQTAAERLSGYEQAMAVAGLPPLFAQGDFLVEGGRRAATALIGEGATALLVANNVMAVGVLKAIRHAGLRIPADVALVSIDDPPWAEITEPPLTTLAPPVRAMAATAVELLLQRVEEGRKRRKRQVFELEMHHRGSCCSFEEA